METSTYKRFIQSHADGYACIELTNLLMPSSDWTIKTFQSFQSDEKMGEAAAAGISLFFWCVGPGLGRLGWTWKRNSRSEKLIEKQSRNKTEMRWSHFLFQRNDDSQTYFLLFPFLNFMETSYCCSYMQFRKRNMCFDSQTI